MVKMRREDEKFLFCTIFEKSVVNLAFRCLDRGNRDFFFWEKECYNVHIHTLTIAMEISERIQLVSPGVTFVTSALQVL